MAHHKINKRNTIRRSINIPVVCTIQGNDYKTSTIDISESGISVAINTTFDPETVVTVNLQYDNWQKTEACITRNIYCEDSKRIITGIRFRHLNLNNLFIIRQLLQLPLTINQLTYEEFPYNLNLNSRNHKLISKQSDISEIIENNFHNKTYMHIKQHRSTMVIESYIESTDGSIFTLKIINEKDYSFFHDLDDLIVYFYHHGSFCIFNALIRGRTADSIELEYPDIIIRLWRRPHPESRVIINEDTKATITSSSSFRSCEYPVIDIGYEGFSIKVPDPETIYSIGYSPISVTLPLHENNITVEATLKYFDEHMYEDCFRGGFEITKITPECKHMLYKFILEKKYPQLINFNNITLDEVWNLFYQSGYMIPEKVEHVKKNIDTINSTWSQLYDINSEIGIMSLFKEKNTLYGALSATQAYNNTWILHQLAAMKHPTIFVAKLLLYFIYQVLIKHLDLDYYKSYYRTNNGWTMQTFLDFKDTCTNERAIHYEFKDLYEKDLVHFTPSNFDTSEIIVEELKNKQDIDIVTNHLKEKLHEIIIKSENLDKEHLFLHELNTKYNKHNLTRKRCFLTAKKGNEIIAYALLELSSTGVNLGGLFDSFQVFTIKEDYENLSLAITQLFDRVCSLYKQYGKKTALCFAGKQNKEFLESIGFKYKIEYVIWYLKREYIIQHIYYLNDFYKNREKN